MQSPSAISSSHTHSGPAPSLANRRTIHFAGRVQGVGFRYTARSIALQHDVSGYVRNLPDGRVELVLEGADSEIDRVMEEILRKMSAFVRGVTAQSAPATGEYDQFSIRH
jgi:acylphosphatase